ncbi:hypothetical protein [Halocynthiibacter styelae]|uniref:Mu-like prophage FluMu N-terminal domain-containing protein n=1 Tax=Halocynthiibacter styelae TaxID=2761955 RepID=A0A8J7LX72_9RHOB|nr:hypothetical protein [Paenihalocynthiibacter styelae]MBI1495397.1 hypothetical protein [Paenihalocynthiibacter styelae]
MAGKTKNPKATETEKAEKVEQSQVTGDAEKQNDAGTGDDTATAKVQEAAKAATQPAGDGEATAELEAEEDTPRSYIEVKSLKPRRRAGLKFGPEPVKIYKGDIDDKRMQAILDDPHLNVTGPKS